MILILQLSLPLSRLVVCMVLGITVSHVIMAVRPFAWVTWVALNGTIGVLWQPLLVPS